MKPGPVTHWLESILFTYRKTVIGFFIVVTVAMAYFATGLHVEAGFTKQLPMAHEYMQTYLKYADEFGGANRVAICGGRNIDGGVFGFSTTSTRRERSKRGTPNRSGWTTFFRMMRAPSCWRANRST